MTDASVVIPLCKNCAAWREDEFCAYIGICTNANSNITHTDACYRCQQFARKDNETFHPTLPANFGKVSDR